MANQTSATYPRSGQRDWSSEIRSAPGDTRSPSDTGLGGMEREASGNGGAQEKAASDWLHMTGMDTDTATRSSMNAAQPSTPMSQTATSMWQPPVPAPQSRTPVPPPVNLGAIQSGNIPGNAGLMGNGENESPTQWADRIGADIENHLPDDMIEAPTTLEEVYRGSMKALLLRNLGNYVVATFLIGTQGTVSWEGILYDVGNDYLAIYQSGRDQYIVSDLYSLKYVEFYDTQRRALCDAVLAEQEQNG